MAVPPKGHRRINLPVGFKTIFLIVLLLTVATFLVNIYLVTRPAEEQTEALKAFSECLDGTFKGGFGAIVGLLVGRHSDK
jgi:fructose-specific phosphotransferase system IIC component